jgi:Phosphate-selective porin O and P
MRSQTRVVPREHRLARSLMFAKAASVAFVTFVAFVAFVALAAAPAWAQAPLQPAPPPVPAASPAPPPDPASSPAAPPAGDPAVEPGDASSPSRIPGDPSPEDDDDATPSKRDEQHGQKHRKKHGKKLKISGFMQMFYRYAFATGSDPAVDPSNFRVQRVRITLTGKLSSRLSYKISFDPRAPEIAGVLRDAYVDIKKVIPHHKIRLGQQKTIFGYENNESSTSLFAVNRAEISDNLARGVSLRDAGIALIGKIPLRDGLVFEDGISVVNGAGFNLQDDNNRRKNVFGRIGLRYAMPGLRLRGGVSASRGDVLDAGADPVDPADDFTVYFRRVGADLELDHRWFWLASEFIYGKEDTATDKGSLSGYYVNLIGKTPLPLGPLVRFDTLGDEYQRLTLGAYYGKPRAKLRVLVNYELRLLKDDVRSDDKLYLWTQVRF